VNAAMAASSDDLIDVRSRIMALKSIRHSKNFAPLAIAFKRIRKILEKAGPGRGDGGSVKAELFREEAEKQLSRSARAGGARGSAQTSGKVQGSAGVNFRVAANRRSIFR